MNAAFLECSIEKQKQILDAGLHLFARFGYKKASTEEIARTAGISKGLLFYYFKNKQHYYEAVYHYATKLVQNSVTPPPVEGKVEFYAWIEQIISEKCKVFVENPDLMHFLASTRVSKEPFIQQLMEADAQLLSQQTMAHPLRGVDISRFRDEQEAVEVMEMLILMLDGYLNSLAKAAQPVALEALMRKYKKWIGILKQATNQEEYR